MTNNNFEKRIKDKLDQFEVAPSENLLENIFEKRASRQPSVLRFSSMKLGIALFSLAAVTVILFLTWPASQTIVSETQQYQNNISDNAVSSEQKSSKLSDQTPSDALADVNRNVKEGLNGDNYRDKISKNHIETGIDLNASKNVNNRRKMVVQDKNNVKLGTSVASLNRSQKKDKFNKGQIEYNDNGSNITERYFNVDAANRPLIASTTHKGKSHLFVYHSVANEKLDHLDLNYLVMKPMKSIPSDKFESDKVESINYEGFARNKGHHHKPIYIDALFTPFFSYQKVFGSTGLEDNYNSMAKTNWSNQLSLRVSYPIADKINIFSGFGLMNLSTKYSGDFVHSENAIRYDKITNYINDPVLGTIAVTHIDTVNYVKNSDLNYDFTNNYQILNIPVGVSYNFGFKDFDFGLHGSALFNIVTHSKGSNADFVHEQTESFQSSKSNMGVGAGLSFMTAYKITNKFKFIVEPGLQYYTLRSVNNGNIVNEKVLNCGLSIGLRYTLF